MKRTYSVFSIIVRIYLQTFKIVPISGILSLIHYVVQGLFPAVLLFIASKLYDAVYRFLNGEYVLQDIYHFAFFLLGGYIVKNILYFTSSITVNAGIYEKCVSYNRMQIGAKTARLPLIFYENTAILNCKDRATECVNSEMLSQIYMSSALFITGGINIIAVSLILASYSLYLVPFSLLSVFPYFIAHRIRGKDFYKIKYIQVEKMRYRDYMWHLLTDRRSIKETRLMCSHEYFKSKWAYYRDTVYEELWKKTKKDLQSFFLCDILRIAGYAASIVLSLILVLQGVISIGVFGACITAFVSVQEETKKFLIEFARLSEKLLYAKDFFEFLDLPEENTGIKAVSGFSDSIEVKDLCFEYPNTEKPAVHNINLTVKKGEKIVIVGENGSGKTTLVKLMLGLYPALSGNITYDGQPIEDIDMQELYHQVSLIQQNFTQYQLTVRENVAISDIAYMHDDNKILHTLTLCGINRFTQTELDTQLGTQFDGTELSGGQWQKIAIARAIFKESSIIILDEPTAALDPLMETEILKSFLDIAAEKTAIIISHRIGLCKYADKIIVMKNGSIDGIGTHTQLIEKNSEYFRLYHAQAKWYQ